MAEINKIHAETARLTMEAEQLRATTLKLQAEAQKIQKDAKWNLWLAIILASVAIVVALVK
ncbi:hypothetical protein [Moraxella sp. ZY200743]|uniref:hypothetical protein n=1 Tax=Moraxella sp. ZY200743 TaxID=2911970 RepID=UPI003D7CA58E